MHLVTCAINAVQNIEKCIRRCGLEVEDIILEQLSSSYAVLTDDERELGVCLVDIGGGTTDIAIFTEEEDVPLGDVFYKIHQKQEGGDQEHAGRVFQYVE